MANKFLDKTGLEMVWAKVLAKQGETLQASKNHADANKTATENKLTADIQAVNQSLTDFKSTKGVANGIATLNSEGKIPSSNLPSYVDDVIEGTYVNTTSFKNTSGTVLTPETGKIYVDTSTNKTYRWSGSTYVEISASLALGETSSTAYAGDKGKAFADSLNNLINRIVRDINEDTSQDALAEWSAIGNYLYEWYYYKSDCDRLFQPKLVSGTTIKTVNGQSILGSGNIAIEVDNIDMSGFYTKTETDSTFLKNTDVLTEDDIDEVCV